MMEHIWYTSDGTNTSVPWVPDKHTEVKCMFVVDVMDRCSCKQTGVITGGASTHTSTVKPVGVYAVCVDLLTPKNTHALNSKFLRSSIDQGNR